MGSRADATETQYLVAGARIVWDSAADGLLPPIGRNRCATINVTDLLGTTGAVVDLLSGDLVEVSTYYPNGARENLWTNDALLPLEPMGFTTKEADEEIGVTYFGERWLIPRLGRWATPDPLHIHASGGGEALNSYHYVSGNLLQAVDPLGLDVHVAEDVTVVPETRGAPDAARSRTSASGARIRATTHARLDWTGRPGQSGGGRAVGGSTDAYGVVVLAQGPSGVAGMDIDVVQLISTTLEAQRRDGGAYRRIRAEIDVAQVGRVGIPARGTTWRVDNNPRAPTASYDQPEPAPAGWNPLVPRPPTGGYGVITPTIHAIFDLPDSEALGRMLARRPREHRLVMTDRFQTFVRHWVNDADGPGHWEIDGVVEWTHTAVAARHADGSITVDEYFEMVQDGIRTEVSAEDARRLATAERERGSGGGASSRDR